MKALAVIGVLAIPSVADAGKYMMGPVPDTGWSWVEDVIQAGCDLGVQAAVLGDSERDAAIEVGLQIGLFRPTRSWLAHSGIELGVSVLHGFDDRWQVRGSFGAGLGPVTLALGWIEELRDGGDSATGVSPELRVRHRVGDGLRKPSIGAFVRADVFAHDRAHHDDRVAIGMFAMVDLY